MPSLDEVIPAHCKVPVGLPVGPVTGFQVSYAKDDGRIIKLAKSIYVATSLIVRLKSKLPTNKF